MDYYAYLCRTEWAAVDMRASPRTYIESSQWDIFPTNETKIAAMPYSVGSWLNSSEDDLLRSPLLNARTLLVKESEGQNTSKLKESISPEEFDRRALPTASPHEEDEEVMVMTKKTRVQYSAMLTTTIA